MSESSGVSPAEDRGAPVSGCLILGMIITVFGGLVILYTVVHFVQKKYFAGFTSDQPAVISVVEPTEAQRKQLNEKLFAIKAATSQGKRERILLTADDLNVLIATADLLKDFRGTTRFESISPRGIATRMSQPVRKMPFSPSRQYLNATFLFQPELRRRTVALRVRDIVSDVGTVPDGFVKNYDAIGFFRLDPESPYIKPYIPKLSRIYTEEGHVVIETGTPADDQSSPKKK